MLLSKSPLLLAHLIGLAMAVGGVAIVDLRLLALFRRRRVTPGDVELIRHVSVFVSGGLALLWMSGLALIAMNLSKNALFLENPKVQAKILIVLILTANGLLVERYALSFIQGGTDGLFEDRTTKQVRLFLLVGAVSTTSWYFAFVFGTFAELNYAAALWVFLSSYLFAIALTYAGLCGLKAVLYDGLVEPGDAAPAALAPSLSRSG